ncbi:MAG: hypothetical protein ACI8XO_002976 [Verrucomicrobiales bacterium]|jgi:hypothetical protein
MRKSFECVLMALVSITKTLVCIWFNLCLFATLPLQASVVLTVPASPPTVANNSSAPPIELDLNEDNTIDFVIPGGSTQINVRPEAPNRFLSFDSFGTFYAADLSEGSFIGATPEDNMV